MRDIIANQTEQVLVTELSLLIEQGQKQVVSQVNSTLTQLFWQVGKRINEDILQKNELIMGNKLCPQCQHN